MKAIVFHGKGDVRVDSVPDATMTAPTDAIVRVVNAAICGSDLWFYRGQSVAWKPGDRTGHEFLGVIEETGSAVTGFRKGQMVAAPFSFSDGSCDYCLDDALYTSCRHGGFWGGNDNDGGQGQFVRVPFADATLVEIPESIRHDAKKLTSALALTDVMGTGHHGNVRAGTKAGSTVAVIGDGAVGLCGVLSAAYLGAERIIAIGHHADRLEIAKKFGATDVIDSKDPDAAQKIIDMTNGGVKHVVEAVGSQATIDFGVSICRPGGNVAYVGIPVGVEKMDFRRLFGSNISVGGALAPVRRYLPEFMEAVGSGKLDPSPVFNLRMPLESAPEGYGAMDARTAIKVCLEISAP